MSFFLVNSGISAHYRQNIYFRRCNSLLNLHQNGEINTLPFTSTTGKPKKLIFGFTLSTSSNIFLFTLARYILSSAFILWKIKGISSFCIFLEKNRVLPQDGLPYNRTACLYGELFGRNSDGIVFSVVVQFENS